MKEEPVWRCDLGGAVELGDGVVAAADHGEDVAGGVVHGHQGALGAGILLEGGFAGGAFHDPGSVIGGEVDVDDVAGLDEGVAVALAGPLPVVRGDDDGHGCRCGRGFRGGGRE